MTQVALVTGGSRGIGGAVVRELAQAGLHVGFTYLHQHERAQALVDELSPARVVSFQADVRCLDTARTIVKSVASELGRLDVLVNNAGIRKDGYLATSAVESWHDVIDTNLTGTFNYTKAALLMMLRRKQGQIINVTSVSGISGQAGQTSYSAAKAGMIGFTKALAKEVASHGVRVNAVAPGLIDSEMTASLSRDTLDALTARIPLERPGLPREVARCIRFLISDDASYVTGQVVRIDGGLET